MSGLELWAGPECTVNRVGDRYNDQLACSGFAERADDIGRLASLGVRRVRMPLLWERIAPDEGGPPDWRWADGRLARLRDAGVKPIAGLVDRKSVV